jgi:hypothetical protein
VARFECSPYTEFSAYDLAASAAVPFCRLALDLSTGKTLKEARFDHTPSIQVLTYVVAASAAVSLQALDLSTDKTLKQARFHHSPCCYTAVKTKRDSHHTIFVLLASAGVPLAHPFPQRMRGKTPRVPHAFIHLQAGAGPVNRQDTERGAL